MAQQGWYPDPGGQSGMFRYWDGSSWSEVISPTPLPGPPSQFGAPTAQPWGSYSTSPSASVTGDTPGIQPPSTTSMGSTSAPGAYGQYQAMAKAKTKKPVGLIVTIIVGVLVLALFVYFLVTRVFTVPVNNPNNPNGNPTTQGCPQNPGTNARADHPNDGRVYGGNLSYPQLGDPWSAVDTQDTRIPFGRDVAEQMIPIQENYDGKGMSWVISVMVGELYAGDGFYDPQEGSQIVNQCIFGTFYGNNKVTADTQRSEAYTLDGYNGWITETNLSFSIPNLQTTSELAIVIIVKTSAMSSSIFYASIPNNAMQYKPDVDAAIADLQVTG